MADRQSSGSNSPDHNECNTQATLTTDQYEQDQICALFIMRCYFLSYSKPNCASWETGFETAVDRFGVMDGPGIAWQCLRTVKAMRKSRHSMFQFCNPFCKCCKNRLTQTEANIMDCICAIRRGESGRLHLSSMMLCEGNSDTDFIASIRTLTNELVRSQN